MSEPQEMRIVIEKATADSKWNKVYDNVIGALVLVVVLGAIGLAWGEWSDTGKNLLKLSSNFKKQEKVNQRLTSLEEVLLAKVAELEAEVKELNTRLSRLESIVLRETRSKPVTSIIDDDDDEPTREQEIIIKDIRSDIDNRMMKQQALPEHKFKYVEE